MSFSETIFLFLLALVVFGPKKLPEIARQAGKLLAELRRASNEFKAQIEIEIAHLEVEKKQAILPPSVPPQGAVASLSLNAVANEPIAHEPPTILAASADGASPTANSALSLSRIASASTAATVADPTSVPAAQDSHV